MAYETSMAKLPRTKRARKSICSETDCARCGETLLSPELYVVTEQGEFPIGTGCAKIVRKAGFAVVPA